MPSLEEAQTIQLTRHQDMLRDLIYQPMFQDTEDQAVRATALALHYGAGRLSGTCKEALVALTQARPSLRLYEVLINQIRNYHRARVDWDPGLAFRRSEQKHKGDIHLQPTFNFATEEGLAALLQQADALRQELLPTQVHLLTLLDFVTEQARQCGDLAIASRPCD
ncbi:hypothetical protein [Niveibacterium sp. SC-1]|uniref:hypothetical protein n=1 Tax=Niveibacterium sp. SC-1 TaxID=3135646 RepID=UPI00311E9D04